MRSVFPHLELSMVKCLSVVSRSRAKQRVSIAASRSIHRPIFSQGDAIFSQRVYIVPDILGWVIITRGVMPCQFRKRDRLWAPRWRRLRFEQNRTAQPDAQKGSALLASSSHKYARYVSQTATIFNYRAKVATHSACSVLENLVSSSVGVPFFARGLTPTV